MLVDTHCHLDFPEFDPDRDEGIRRAKDNNVDFIINIGSSVEGSRRSVELSRRYPNIFSVVGIHPHEADTFSNSQREAVRELAADNKVVAIGETGLDYFKNFSQSSNQRLLFSSLLELAGEFNKPLVIHTRQASDTLEILKRDASARSCTCFQAITFPDECLVMGFFISLPVISPIKSG